MFFATNKENLLKSYFLTAPLSKYSFSPSTAYENLRFLVKV
jgi:hypothetical protein